MDTETILIDLLSDSRVFRGLDRDELLPVARAGQIRRFETRETIIREGQTDHPLFIIVTGRVEAVLPRHAHAGSSERPTRVRLGWLQQGDCVGEYSVIDGLPASADVVALEPCRMFALPRAAFAGLITADNRTARIILGNLLRLMIGRARQRNRELDLCY